MARIEITCGSWGAPDGARCESARARFERLSSTLGSIFDARAELTMEPDRRNRVSELYHAALQRTREERGAFLDAACVGDEPLRQEIESLLAVESSSSRFLERPAVEVISRGAAAAVGRQLGSYQVLAPLGTGGMGEVYRARDSRLGRDVAIKVLPAYFTADPERRARFAREARMLATLNHPHIGAIYGLEEADGATALVLELVEGPTLADCLARGPLPVPQALAVARDIADGLEAAHQKNIIHRDLKPANIVLQGWTAGSKAMSGDPRARVLDFGLAKSIGFGGDEDPGMNPGPSVGPTVPGRILGTPAYMSPEQTRGESIDTRTDIWAFGCVLFELLTGRLAFEGKTVTDTLAAVLEHQPDWAVLPATTPETIRRLVRRCLEKDPRRRLRDVGDARLEVEEALTHVSSTSADSLDSPGSSLHGTIAAASRARHRRRREQVAWSLAALLALAAAAAILFQDRSMSSPPIAPKRFVVTLPDLRFTPFEGRSLSLVPDGSGIVYLAGAPEDPWRIHLYTLSDGVSRALGGTDRALHPTVSPDGQWVAFYRANRLMKVAIAGGSAVPICDVPFVRGISWGADDWIVFAVDSGLQRVPAAGGEAQTLTTLQDGESFHVSPYVLPDGRAVLFTVLSRSGAMEDAAIGVVSVATRLRQTLLKDAGDARYSPTGHLVYVHQTDLMAVSFDAERFRLSGTPFLAAEAIRVSPDRLQGSFDLARDGTLVWIAASALQRMLVWIDRKGVETPLPIPVRPYAHPALMPDERGAIVEIEATPHNLWYLDLTTGALTPLTHGSGNHRPVLSPDGRYFAFSSDRTTPRSLFRQATDGSGAPDPLVNATLSHQNATSWSSDGRWLAYEQIDKTTRDDIWVLALDTGSKPRAFLQKEYSESQATFSPDSRWIAYTTDESGRSEVMIRSFPGEGLRRQVSTTGGETPAFSSDGRTIFYRLKDQLLAVSISADPVPATGLPSVAFKLSGVLESIGVPNHVISRRGDRVLAVKNLSEDTRARDVQVVVNWFDSLRRASTPLRESSEPAR